MEVVRIDGIDPEWDRFVWDSPGGTIFHTLKFLSYHPLSRFDFVNLAMRKAGRLVCVIPGGRVDAGGRALYRSPVGASFGGFVFAGNQSLKTVFEAVGVFIDHLKESGFAAAEITLPPGCYSESGDQALGFAMASSGFETLSREATAVVPLGAAGPENLAPSVRRNLRRAEESGIRVKTGGATGPFYEILAANLAAKGATPTHTAEELQRLIDLFPKRILLFEGWLDDRLVGGCLSLICNQRSALVFYICDHPDFRRFRVAEFVLHGCLVWFKEQGYTYLDLGTISIDGQVNWGLARFKSKFMAETYVREKYVLRLKE